MRVHENTSACAAQPEVLSFVPLAAVPWNRRWDYEPLLPMPRDRKIYGVVNDNVKF